MMTIQASQLEVGSIIHAVDGNPNIRGTVVQVNRFGGVVANKNRTPSPTQTNPQANPNPLETARIIAKEVDDCYNDSQPSSVTVRIGARNINLNADTKITVWVPAADVMHALYGR